MGDAEKLATEHVSEMPEPQEHAIEAEAEGRDQGTAHDHPYAGQVDADGTPFDPEVHATSPDGTPSQTSKGRWRKRRGRQGRRSQLHDTAVDRQREAQRQQIQAAATYTVDSIGMLGQIIGGQEWQFLYDPQTGLDERAQGIEAWRRYYEARGITDIPPGAAIALWGVSYVAIRMTRPQTQTRMQRAWSWIKRKWGRNGSRVDSGDDRIRQDDVGKNAGGTI